MFEAYLTQLFAPLLKLPFSLFILIVSSLLSLINILIIRFLVDHDKAKEYKKKMEEIRNKAMELQKKDPKKAEEEMKKVFELMNKQMHMNIKPMIVSSIFFLILVPWLVNISAINVHLTKNNTGYVVIDRFVPQEKNFTVKVSDSKLFFDIDNNGFWDVSVKNGEIFDYYGRWQVKINEKEVKLQGNVKTPIPIPFFSSGFGFWSWYLLTYMVIFFILRKLFGLDY